MLVCERLLIGAPYPLLSLVSSIKKIWNGKRCEGLKIDGQFLGPRTMSTTREQRGRRAGGVERTSIDYVSIGGRNAKAELGPIGADPALIDYD